MFALEVGVVRLAVAGHRLAGLAADFAGQGLAVDVVAKVAERGFVARALVGQDGGPAVRHPAQDGIAGVACVVAAFVAAASVAVGRAFAHAGLPHCGSGFAAP